MSKTIPILLVPVLLALLVAVCTGPAPRPAADLERLALVESDLLDDSRDVAANLARFDRLVAEHHGLTPATVTALRELAAPGTSAHESLGAIETFGAVERAWGSELLALLSAQGQGERVAAALAAAGGEVGRAERLLRDDVELWRRWTVFSERRESHRAALAEVPLPRSR